MNEKKKQKRMIEGNNKIKKIPSNMRAQIRWKGTIYKQVNRTNNTVTASSV